MVQMTKALSTGKLPKGLGGLANMAGGMGKMGSMSKMHGFGRKKRLK